MEKKQRFQQPVSLDYFVQEFLLKSTLLSRSRRKGIPPGRGVPFRVFPFLRRNLSVILLGGMLLELLVSLGQLWPKTCSSSSASPSPSGASSSGPGVAGGMSSSSSLGGENDTSVLCDSSTSMASFVRLHEHHNHEAAAWRMREMKKLEEEIAKQQQGAAAAAEAAAAEAHTSPETRTHTHTSTASTPTHTPPTTTTAPITVPPTNTNAQRNNATAPPQPRNSLEEAMDALRLPLVDAARVGDIDQVRALIPIQRPQTTTPDDAAATPDQATATTATVTAAQAEQRRALQTIPFFGALHANHRTARNLQSSAPIALYTAAAGGHLDVVRYLVEQACVDANCYSGGPLSHAVHNGHLHIVQYLVEEGGANINRQTTQRQATALMYAAGEGKHDVVRWMLFHGADATMMDVFGDTAAVYAEKAGHESCARLCRLRERGTPLRWTRAMHPAHPPETRKLAETLIMCANRGHVPPKGIHPEDEYTPCPIAAVPLFELDSLVADAVHAYLWG